MDTPDAATVRGASQLNFATLGYPPGATPDPLEVPVQMAVEYVQEVTGRQLDDSMPDNLDMLALQAVVMRTEQVVYASQADRIEGVTDEGIASFSVPGYSETRRDARSIWKEGLVNPWRMLSDILWLLMTPEKRDEWQAQFDGEDPPAFEITEVDWGIEGVLRGQNYGG